MISVLRRVLANLFCGRGLIGQTANKPCKNRLGKEQLFESFLLKSHVESGVGESYNFTFGGLSKTI